MAPCAWLNNAPLSSCLALPTAAPRAHVYHQLVLHRSPFQTMPGLRARAADSRVIDFRRWFIASGLMLLKRCDSIEQASERALRSCVMCSLTMCVDRALKALAVWPFDITGRAPTIYFSSFPSLNYSFLLHLYNELSLFRSLLLLAQSALLAFLRKVGRLAPARVRPHARLMPANYGPLLLLASGCGCDALGTLGWGRPTCVCGRARS